MVPSINKPHSVCETILAKYSSNLSKARSISGCQKNGWSMTFFRRTAPSPRTGSSSDVSAAGSIIDRESVLKGLQTFLVAMTGNICLYKANMVSNTSVDQSLQLLTGLKRRGKGRGSFVICFSDKLMKRRIGTTRIWKSHGSFVSCSATLKIGVRYSTLTWPGF